MEQVLLGAGQRVVDGPENSLVQLFHLLRFRCVVATVRVVAAAVAVVTGVIHGGR